MYNKMNKKQDEGMVKRRKLRMRKGEIWKNQMNNGLVSS